MFRLRAPCHPRSVRRKRQSGVMMSELRLGFAGVGKMGGLMAARLIEAGHPLTVFDANDLAVEPLVKAGAKRAKTLRDLAGQAKIVFASLPTPDVVREVALGT